MVKVPGCDLQSSSLFVCEERYLGGFPSCSSVRLYKILICWSCDRSIRCWSMLTYGFRWQCRYFQRSIQSQRNPYVSMDQHLIDLSQLQQIKILYNLTDEQLGKPPKYLSSQTKRLEDCKSHPGTFTLNLKIIYCRPTIRTCGSEASGSL